MTGHEKRAAQIEKRIIEISIRLFDIYSIKKVSVDEIAEKADVSKVTIYKYFGNKKGLVDAVIQEIYTMRIHTMEDILNKDMDFKEKLHLLMNIKKEAGTLMGGRFLKEILKENADPSYVDETKKLFTLFFEEGKRKGYIDSTIPNEVLISYFDIFRAGLESHVDGISSLLHQDDVFAQMINLFFYGFVKRE